MPSSLLSLFFHWGESSEGQWQGAAVRTRRRAAPAQNAAGLAGLGPRGFWRPASRPVAGWLRRASPGARKATVSADLLLEGKANLTGINLCAPLSGPIRPQASGRLSGDGSLSRKLVIGLEGRDPGTLSGTPLPWRPLSPMALDAGHLLLPRESWGWILPV